ncbi:MAG: sigma-70 family RNA polymerase sigma factor [Methylovulum sp.]|nr:sigma-70 family RNA polymerase sigma factor [Methylovulum sp.]
MMGIAEQTQDPSIDVAGNGHEDLMLMRRIADRDTQAFETLYYGYAPRIGKFLMALLKYRELADEAMNDTMLTVWQNAGRFDPGQGRLASWLFGIAHNKGLKLLERQRRHQREETLDTVSGDYGQHEAEAFSAHVDVDNPERIVLGWELGDNLLWALEQLTCEHRAVLELTFTEHCTYQEIALITGCPVNTVKTRMFHARKKLTELLALRGYAVGS